MSHEVHCQVLGDGPGRWVLCMHGFLGSGRNLSTFVRRWMALDAGIRPVLIDLPGHGQSGPVSPDAGLEGFALPVLELADELAGSAPVSLLGHSLGGRVALAMAREAPERIEQVTLLDIAPGPVAPQPEIQGVMAALAEAPDQAQTRTEMREVLLERGLSRPLSDWLLMNLKARAQGGLEWRIDRTALLEGHRHWSATNLWDVVETEESPVRLTVRGGASGFVDEPTRVRLEAAGCRVETLPGAGHFLHAQKPAELAALLAAA